MASLAVTVHEPRCIAEAGIAPLYPEEIEYLNRPATTDSDQLDCIHCKSSFSEHRAGWLVGARRKCCCKRYDPF